MFELTEEIFYKGAVLLRIRGFLHAFHLVEMTIPKNVISSEVERSSNLWYEQRCLSRRFFACALNDNRVGCLTMGGVASH